MFCLWGCCNLESFKVACAKETIYIYNYKSWNHSMKASCLDCACVFESLKEPSGRGDLVLLVTKRQMGRVFRVSFFFSGKLTATLR